MPAAMKKRAQEYPNSLISSSGGGKKAATA
jgi:hypothetical protein